MLIIKHAAPFAGRLTARAAFLSGRDAFSANPDLTNSKAITINGNSDGIRTCPQYKSPLRASSVITTASTAYFFNTAVDYMSFAAVFMQGVNLWLKNRRAAFCETAFSQG